MRRLIGIGCDIVQVARIEKACHSDLFLQKVFSASEQTYFKKYHYPWPIISGHFAAKEAVAKALGTGFSQGITFQDLLINHELSGKPYLELSLSVQQKWPGICVELSISHEQDYAVAYALAYLN